MGRSYVNISQQIMWLDYRAVIGRLSQLTGYWPVIGWEKYSDYRHTWEVNQQHPREYVGMFPLQVFSHIFSRVLLFFLPRVSVIRISSPNQSLASLRSADLADQSQLGNPVTWFCWPMFTYEISIWLIKILLLKLILYHEN